MIVPRVFKSRQRKRKNISIVLSSQQRYRVFPGTFFLYIEKAKRLEFFAIASLVKGGGLPLRQAGGISWEHVEFIWNLNKKRIAF